MIAVNDFVSILIENGYDKKTIDKILNKNIRRILGRKTCELKKLVQIIKENELDITKCLSVLVRGKSAEIEKILKLLKQENINVKNCLTILAQGKSAEIEKILKLLKQENINVRKCLYILAQGKSKEIEKILKLLKQENIDVRNCLTILAQGKSEEIEKILKLLKQENINVRECLYILVQGKSEEIEKNIDLLKKEGIDLNRLVDIGLCLTLLVPYSYIYELFKENNKDFVSEEKDIKLYVKLKYGYDKYFNLYEINNICNHFNINIDNFISIFKNGNLDFCKVIINNLIKGKSFWIGKSYKISSEDLKNYQSIILEVCDISSGLFCKKNGISYLKQDYAGYCLDIIIEKCGDIFYCYGEEEVILKKVLTSYCLKTLYNYLPAGMINLDKKLKFDSEATFTDMIGQTDKEYDKIEEFDIFENIELDELETDLLNYMNVLLEEGYSDYESIIKEHFNLDDGGYQKVMSNIRKKLSGMK